MHNGGIAEFSKIKRRLQSYLSDELFDFVTGNTGVFTMEYGYRFSSLIVPPDSQWAFALFLSKLPDPHAKKFSTQTLRQAMTETIASINEMTEAVNATEVCPTALCPKSVFFVLMFRIAEPHEFLRDGWGEHYRHTLH